MPVRLELDAGGCALHEDPAPLAPPCALDPTTREVDCLLPRTAMPRFLAIDARSDSVPPTLERARLPIGPARDVVATSAQICVIDADGAVSCMRPGAPLRRVADLPRVRALALGLGCGEILCAVSEAHELVCVATASRSGAVRVPDVAAVTVEGCEVCMAALDGRVACFGASTDAGPFESSPRVVTGRVCSASGSRQGSTDVRP